MVIKGFSINFSCERSVEHRPHGGPMSSREVPLMPRTESTSEFQPLEDKEVEYFFASDASAVIEHTNRVIYLEASRFYVMFRDHNFLCWPNFFMTG